jgi:hypothetical protein
VNKRAYKRTLADLEFSCFDEDNFGTVKNLSENDLNLKYLFLLRVKS